MSRQGETLLVKIGSNSNIDASGIREDRLEHIASQTAGEISRGNRVAIVISGALALAETTLLDTTERDDERITDQMRATRGNAAFFNAWIAAFDERGIRAGEFLVTHHELNYPPEAASFTDTIEHYLALAWVPLVNESGSTDDRETKKLAYGGDNDGLAEVVADKIGADRIFFLTEKEGVIGKDKKLIEVVDANNAQVAISAAGKAGERGKGGMRTKVEAALKSAGKGRSAHIAHAGHDFQPIRMGQVGTFFVPRNAATSVVE